MPCQFILCTLQSPIALPLYRRTIERRKKKKENYTLAFAETFVNWNNNKQSEWNEIITYYHFRFFIFASLFVRVVRCRGSVSSAVGLMPFVLGSAVCRCCCCFYFYCTAICSCTRIVIITVILIMCHFVFALERMRLGIGLRVCVCRSEEYVSSTLKWILSFCLFENLFRLIVVLVGLVPPTTSGQGINWFLFLHFLLFFEMQFRFVSAGRLPLCENRQQFRRHYNRICFCTTRKWKWRQPDIRRWSAPTPKTLCRRQQHSQLQFSVLHFSKTFALN